MSLDTLTAAQIYAEAAKGAGNAASGASVPEADKPNFGALVNTAMSNTVGDLKAGEAAAASVVTGDASLVDVVTAVSAAEVTLEAAIAVRNRVIEAYQDVMRMPI